MGGIISNPDNVKITEKRIYNDIIEYSVEEPYYFESCGVKYGNHIYGFIELSNYYTIKKRNESEDN